jgi:hypothetical protein
MPQAYSGSAVDKLCWASPRPVFARRWLAPARRTVDTLERHPDASFAYGGGQIHFADPAELANVDQTRLMTVARATSSAVKETSISRRMELKRRMGTHAWALVKGIVGIGQRLR